ncbi:MAG: DNA-formamidopyrimidine glycosylase [Bacilli bacterium]|nr:DNA-formamidopyrimidine glycosylase [Bacilli bacterium]
MPELPEVRTVAGVLKKLINKKIVRINIHYPKIINQNSLDIKLLIGKTLKDINTIGKYLLFDFEEYILISHLRMEGKYYIKNINAPLNKHEHLEFIFNDSTSLRYHDTRKFGRMHLVKSKDLNKVESIAKLGGEPFALSKEEFYNKISKKKISIKSLLLDQTIIAGLGNIYANEVLFASKINPFKLGLEITLEEADAILDASIKILNLAIKEKGTTIKSYTSSLGVAGNYQKHLKVHLKSGEKCEVCHSEILQTKIGGRSTYYCPVCQKY